MDIANPMRADGALDYVPDIWGWLAQVLSDMTVAGGASLILGIILWAVVAKVKPQYSPSLVAKAVVMGILSPTLVIGISYALRLLGHQDYFTLERVVAVGRVWFYVTAGTGVWAILAHSLGIDLDRLLELIRQVLGERKAEKQAAQQ